MFNPTNLAKFEFRGPRPENHTPDPRKPDRVTGCLAPSKPNPTMTPAESQAWFYVHKAEVSEYNNCRRIWAAKHSLGGGSGLGTDDHGFVGPNPHTPKISDEDASPCTPPPPAPKNLSPKQAREWFVLNQKATWAYNNCRRNFVADNFNKASEKRNASNFYQKIFLTGGLFYLIMKLQNRR